MSKLSFSHRTNWPLSSNRPAQILDQLKKEEVDVIDLTASNPTRCQFEYLSASLLAPFGNNENLQYVPLSQGSLKARECVSCYYQEKGVNVDPSQIFLTSSTSEAYTYLFRLLVNPQEGVLFPQPSYPLFQFLGDLNDVPLEFYPLIYEHGWQLDFNHLEELLSSNVKAIVMVNPNNPTGSFVRREDMMRLVDLCRSKGVALISDEVFGDFVFKQESYTTLAQYGGSLTFVLGGVSKTLGLPQMKLSWIVVNGEQNLVQQALQRLEIVADTYLSVNTPTQNAFIRWMEMQDEIQSELKGRLRDNLKKIQDSIGKKSSCEVLRCEGGWYAVLKIPNIQSEEDWVVKFLSKDQVLVHPGYFYDFQDEAFIVLSLLPVTEVFEEGLRRVLKRIQLEVS